MRFARRFLGPVVSVTVTALVATGIAAASAPNAAAVSIGPLAGAGPRPNATRLTFDAGDRVRAHVDVGSGNLYVTVKGLALQGVGSQLELSAFYNTAASGE